MWQSHVQRRLAEVWMARLPFSVFRRKNRRFFYVQFKSQEGGYLPAVSTKQATEEAAIETAFRWLRDGKPSKLESERAESKSLEGCSGGKGGAPDDNAVNISISLRDALRNIKSAGEAEFFCGELKRQGLLKTYIVAGSRQDEDFAAFLQTFWNYDISPYVKEKLRKNHGIHRNYTKGQKLSAEKYWAPFFKSRLLGSISRKDIDDFIDDLAGRKLSAGRRNIILKAGTIPLRWAFSKEYIEKDITAGITWFSGKTAERQILTPEIAQAIFRVDWEDERARLANMLAAVTGLRAQTAQKLDEIAG